MESGYVLAFSNRTFEEFFKEVVKVNIYNLSYAHNSGSKANRLRAFWQSATKAQTLLFLYGILEAWDIYSNDAILDSAEQLINRIIIRLEGKSVSQPATN